VERGAKAKLAIFDELLAAPALSRHPATHVDLHEAVRVAAIAPPQTLVHRFAKGALE
jgi:hypothetical protein